MSHPPYLREKARELRVDKGLTIDEIAERLALPRTTIFSWVCDLPIPRTSRQTARQQRGTAGMQSKWRRLREEAYADGRELFADLVQDPTFCDFVCLYIAEGYKRSRNSVSICNSDPAVIALATAWIRRFTDHRLSFSIQYHADQDIDELRAYWGRALGIDGGIIRFQRKSNSGQLRRRSWRSEHGVIAVSAHDTYFRARLEAWMDLTRESWLTLGP